MEKIYIFYKEGEIIGVFNNKENAKKEIFVYLHSKSQQKSQKKYLNKNKSKFISLYNYEKISIEDNTYSLNVHELNKIKHGYIPVYEKLHIKGKNTSIKSLNKKIDLLKLEPLYNK